MAQEMTGDIERLKGRSGGEHGLTNGEEDISGGVEVAVGNVPAFTLYLAVSTATAIDVTVELSPDGGSNWYVPDESPISFASSDDYGVEHIPYNASRVRLTGSNATPVKAQLREVV